MKLEEFQAKILFREYGIPVPDGTMVNTSEEARSAAEEIGCPVVIKAQVQAGGRGKAGGVKLAKTPAEAYMAANAILGMDIKGFIVERLLVDPAVSIAGEYYVGITFDRRKKMPVMMASASGGVDIEKVAAANPEQIFFGEINPERGLRSFEAKQLAFQLFTEKKKALATASIMMKLWDCFHGEASHYLRAEGTRREKSRFKLCTARWQYRLHGQRGGPRSGNYGPYQASWRHSG